MHLLFDSFINEFLSSDNISRIVKRNKKLLKHFKSRMNKSKNIHSSNSTQNSKPIASQGTFRSDPAVSDNII